MFYDQTSREMKQQTHQFVLGRAAVTAIFRSPATAEPPQAIAGPKPQRLPAPPMAKVQSALGQVHNICSAEYAAAKTAEAKSKLAKQLESNATPDQPTASRTALLREAVRLAVGAGDARGAVDAAGKMIAAFEIDRDAVMLEIYQSLLRTVTPATARDLGESILKFTDEALRLDRTETLEKAIPHLLSVSRQARDPVLANAASEMKLGVAEKTALQAELVPLRAKLAASPSDPQPNLELGKLLCFAAGEWDEGLPYLAKGNDAALAAIATAEVAAGARLDARAALVLADGWYDWLQGQKGSYRSASEARAIGHYLAARASITGLEGVRVGKRIAELKKNAGFKGIVSPLQDQKFESLKGNSDPFWRPELVE